MYDHFRVDCPVDVEAEQEFGIFANAFRVVETKERSVLEFFVYSSAVEGKALLVGNVPVRKAFLPVIRDRIDEQLADLLEE